MLRRISGPGRDEVAGGWRKMHNEELRNLHSSLNIIRVFKSWRTRWADHAAHMGETRNAYNILTRESEGKRPLGRPRGRWEDNMRMDLGGIVWAVVDWMNLAQDRDHWRALVNTVINVRVP
jgi:hypothetical protein